MAVLHNSEREGSRRIVCENISGRRKKVKDEEAEGGREGGRGEHERLLLKVCVCQESVCL